MPKLERERKAAAEERSAANAARAKLEVDVTDLEEQIEKHAQTQAGSALSPPLMPVHYNISMVVEGQSKA